MPPVTPLDQLIELLTKYKHTTPTGTPSTPYYTGPGGLFGVSGLERDVISTRIGGRGLADVLPAYGTTRVSPLFPYITGFRDVSGSNPDGVCDDCQVAGPGKSCIQTAQFGRYCFMTRELELNRVGQQIDRGEFQDLTLINDPLLDSSLNTTPNVSGSPEFRREVLMRMMEVGIAFQNKLMRQLWEANPANNSAGNGYREFPGLNILIGTNKVDALSGTECPSLDSDIKDFNYQNVTDLTSDADIVNVLTYMYRYVKHIAINTKLMPTTWAFVMRPSLFYEITAMWPCSYLTYRCAFRAADGTVVQNVDAGDQVAMRDAMRQGSYLLIDGEQIRVIQDDAIVEETNTTNANVPNPCFASDIYLIPLTIMGGRPTTFWQYLDYTQGAMIAATDGQYAPGDFWTDGGRFFWHKKPPLNWCVQWLAKIEPRVILQTPHLAGRLQNVVYCPLQHTRDMMPDDPYNINGGVYTERAGRTLYSDWNMPN